jgi:hypothetical protein
MLAHSTRREAGALVATLAAATVYYAVQRRIKVVKSWVGEFTIGRNGFEPAQVAVGCGVVPITPALSPGVSTNAKVDLF